MDRYASRPKGAMGSLLDVDKLGSLVRRLSGDDRAVACFGRYVVVYGKGQKWAVVNTEGVGVEAADYDSPSVVWWRVEYEPETDENGRTFQRMDMAAKEVNVSINDIHECVTGESIDLADHVRIFGDRLDVNHDDWWWFVKAEEMAEV